MGLFGRKKLKIAELSGGGLYAYDIDPQTVDRAALASHNSHPLVQEATVGSVSKVSVFLINERTDNRKYSVVVPSLGGEVMAEIDDRGLWEVVVRSLGAMKLNGVQCSLRVEMDPTSNELVAMSLDLPSGFPGDLASSPHFRVVEMEP